MVEPASDCCGSVCCFRHDTYHCRVAGWGNPLDITQSGHEPTFDRNTQQGMSIHILDYAPATSAAYGDIRPATQQQNDYLIDWEVQRRRKYFGVPGVGAQDQAITESQQPIVDRTQERLGRADLGIIRVRLSLLDAAVALRDRGTLPPGMAPTSFRIRPASVLLPTEVPWVEGSRERRVARVTSPTSLT